MVAPTPDQIALIKRFEPILYFAPGERFFPSDVKRYVEHCNLWRAIDPTQQFATASTWGAAPVIPAGKIVVTASEAGSDDVFLGKKSASGGFEFLTSSPGQESFLDLFGWRPPDSVLTNASRYANIEAIANAYAQGSLNDGQFWYHAEFFATDRLNSLFATVLASGGHDFADLLRPHDTAAPVLNNPALICYYLFFPAHEEGLPACSSAEALHFGDYGGDWACVPVLIDQPTTADPFEPLFIGLTNRNIGLVKQPDGSEVRVGMRVKPWSDVPTTDAPDHPSLAVAKGTHALYFRGETPTMVTPFTPDDLARASCGAAEGIQASGSSSDPTALGYIGDTALMFAKILAGTSLAAGLTGGLGAVVGLVAGFKWWLGEISTPFGAAPLPVPPSPTVDTVAPTNSSGKVIHPADVDLPNVAPANAVPWPTDGQTINQRRYDIYVDRDATVLWPDDPQKAGFQGRWGPRVENDSFLRRSGMLFPGFWRMFFDALVLSDLPGADPTPPPPTQKAIPQTDGVPIGNATGENTGGPGLAAGYDGNFDKTWAQSPSGADKVGVYIGKRFTASHRFTGVEIQLSSDLGFNANDGATRNCTVYGKTDVDPTGPTDGDKLFIFPAPGVPDQAGYNVKYLSGFDTTNTYDRVWVTLDDSGDGLSVFTQVVWYATDS
jgi:hypothetical protein